MIGERLGLTRIAVHRISTDDLDVEENPRENGSKKSVATSKGQRKGQATRFFGAD